MVFNGLIPEYSLEGTSNFVAWKDHLEEVLDENRFLEYIKIYVVKPPKSDAQNLA